MKSVVPYGTWLTYSVQHSNTSSSIRTLFLLTVTVTYMWLQYPHHSSPYANEHSVVKLVCKFSVKHEHSLQ